MEDLYQEGKIRAIGVSNFLPHHLDALLETARIIPAVNQVRLAPGVYQEEVVDYCREKGILLEAWGPLAKESCLNRKKSKKLLLSMGNQWLKLPWLGVWQKVSYLYLSP